MKTIIHDRRVFFAIMVISTLFIASLGSCAKRVAFSDSSVVPGAEGRVKVKSDANDNYVIDVLIKNLAEPGRLSPPKGTYVVWAETDDGAVKNLGQINTSSGLFSDMRKASLTSTMPFKPTRIFITAEDAGDVQHPGMQVVLRTQIFALK